MTTIRVILPFHLTVLAKCEREIDLSVQPTATIGQVLDALEARYPMLRGTVRDHVTQRRRPLVRFYACEEDLSHEGMEHVLPAPVLSRDEPFIILGAIAGG